MAMKKKYCLFFLLICALAQKTAGAQPAQVSSTENCYDPKLGLVQPLQKGRCRAQIISDEEASHIRQERIERIRKALQPQASSVAAPLKMKSIGTGFFVTTDGSLLTNNHVVRGCMAVTATTTTGITLPAKVVGAEEASDLALLKAEVTVMEAARFRTEVSLDGQPVAAIGYPDHGMVPVMPILTRANLSGPPLTKGRILFHGDVRPGNSGGPLLDESGLVVGVVFAKADTVKIYQASGQLVRDLGFAISNKITIGFLATHHIPAAVASSGPLAALPELLDKAAPFIARIGCWK